MEASCSRAALVCARGAIALGAAALSLTGCGRMPPEKIASQGTLNLESHDWKRTPAITITGDFAFSWKELTNPRAPTPARPTFAHVPGSWNKHIVAGKMIGGNGYGTYRATVRLPAAAPPLALRVLHFDSAHRLHVNGELLHQAGVVGTNAKDTSAGRIPGTVRLPRTDRLDFVIHVSNYQHRNGGFPRPLLIGEQSVVESAQLRDILMDVFLVGSLIMIGLYHLGLFTLRRSDRSALYFAAFCILIAARTSVVGERIVEHVFPNLPFVLEHRIEYISFYLAAPVFLHYAGLVFEGAFNRLITLVVTSASCAASAFVALAPSLWYSQTNIALQVLTLLVGLYILGTVGRLAFQRRPGAGTFLIGFGLLFASVVNDILYTRWIVQTGFLVSLGLFAFVLVQGFLLSQKLMSAFRTAEVLAVDLANSERRYRHLVEDSGEIIVSLDKSGRIQDVNQAVRSLLGIPPRRITGQPITTLLHGGYATNGFMGRRVFDEHLAQLQSTGMEQQFSAEFRTVTGEPCELAVRLQRVEQEGEHAIFGNLARRAENLLARYCEADHRRYSIATSFSLSEVLNRSITSGLEGRLPEGDVMMLRLALREILANSIEHGNLNITFEEKTEATEEGKLYELLAERLADPRYRDRLVRVSVNLSENEAVFDVEDEGAGFDHVMMLARAREPEKISTTLLHGRGLTYALGLFDSVTYNEKGNAVRLVKKLPSRALNLSHTTPA